MQRSAPWQSYNSRVLWLGVLYAIFLIGAVYGFKRDLVSGGMAYVVAVLPALPIIGIFAALGRYLVEERDEYQRMLKVRQMLWASGFALSLATIWGFLEGFDLIGHVDGYYVAVAWFGGLGLGACINRYTLGSAGRC